MGTVILWGELGLYLTQCRLVEAYPYQMHLDPSSSLATTDMGQKLGALPLWGGAGSPSNRMWPGPRPTSMPTFILTHATVWPQYTNVTDRQNRRDRQTTVRQDRANRFTNGGPKTKINTQPILPRKTSNFASKLDRFSTEST